MLYLQIASPKSSVLNFLDSNSFEVIISIFQRTEKVPDMERLPKEKQGVWNKEGQMIPCFNDSSKGIDAVAHIRVTADYIDSREGGRIRILKHGAEP